MRATDLDQESGLSAVGHNTFCRSCGQPNPKHNLYCTRCGQYA
jgi:predicted amidophosphoribosyltransferase